LLINASIDNFKKKEEEAREREERRQPINALVSN